MSKKGKLPERFAMIPLEAMQSEAFRWLPSFAVRALVALAAKFNGFNNGGLELTTKDAELFGLTERELFAGIGLCMRAGFAKRTVEARRRSGKGAPARYALTWRAMGDFPRFNIVPTAIPTKDWQRFERPFARPRSVTEARILLGHEKRRPARLHAPPPQDLRGFLTRAP